MSDDRELVFSSEAGWKETPQRRGPKAGSKDSGGKSATPDDGVVRVARERRRGSVVTLIHGLRASEVAQTGKTLKKLCGAGGTTKNGILEIQGDHRATVVTWFVAQGRKAKLAGG